MPFWTVMERVATMKKTRRKNMVSIMGMISIRAFFRAVFGSLTTHSLGSAISSRVAYASISSASRSMRERK
ncbi:MAG: hypothetical protein A4E57_03566 [Syntrophorhabdaceae bacterium PtaU1.Bin034]|nr:MAG: hypothetical protein A4E57_03566 [Syntrophorhabdaceae bacterium PtaU1.Bin034]